MLKGIAAVFVMTGCLGLGVWHRQQLSGRIRALGRLQGILELLASQVRYGKETLPECCRHLSPRLKPPFDSAFLEVADQMEQNTGASFAEVFAEQMRAPLLEMPLTEEDRETFLRFASRTGYADGQMQLRILEQSGRWMEETAGRLKQENGEKSRMALGLGILGGLLLILTLW